MTRNLWPMSLGIMLAGCGSATIDGTLVDALTNAPIAETSVMATADGQVRMTCQKLAGLTDAQGVFSISGACLSDSTYTLSTSNEDLWLGDISTVPTGGFEGPIQLKAWRAPKGSGVFTLAGTTLTSLRTVSDLKTETFYLSDPAETVEYPAEIPPPSKIGQIAAGGYLVYASKDHCDNLELIPLIEDKAEDKEDGKRRFGDKEKWYDMEPWWFVGVKFTSDTEWERVAADIDTSKLIRQENDSHAACFLPHGIVSPGRYVIRKKGAKRVYMVDFQ